MRVAIVADPYVPIPPTGYGGIEKIIYYLIQGLMEQGHEPILIGPGDSRVPCELLPTCPRAEFFPSDTAKLPAFEAKVRDIKKRSRNIIREILPRVDIIHSHGFDLSSFRDYPNLTTLHGPINLHQLKYYHSDIRKSLYYVAISKNQAAALPSLQYVGIVYNGEDPKEFPIIQNPDNYVCFVGRFDREKNPHLAIELALSLDMKIKLAGKVDFQGRDYFDQEIKKYLDHPLVEYLGVLPPEDSAKLMAHARCNLHPTGFREPFGLTILEAAYAGTPTLAIARGAPPEIIEDGRTGVLVEDFVEGHHLLNDCFEMDRAYIAARARALFNYQVMTKQYIRAYQKVIGLMGIKRAQRSRLQNLTAKTIRELRHIWEDSVGPPDSND
ncbi:MAG TPA: glycosyltransferase [Candidatus Saccharimonadales bacterium]|nr:glycosyltransferase [Candidatus Saccharimonadales bacterium]